jgi:hypothetical protein
MSRLSIQVHKADGYNPAQMYFVFNGADGWPSPTQAMLIQAGDDQLVSDLREAADKMEKALAKGKREAEIKARIEAELASEEVA